MEQWNITGVLEDHEEQNWRPRAQAMCELLSADLQRRGLTPEYAPEMPPLAHGLQGVIKQPFRMLMTWVPPEAFHEYAGRYVVRADTMTQARAKKAGV